MPKMDVMLLEVLTPEQLSHVKIKAKEVVKKNLTWAGRIILALGGQYYVLDYTKTGVHIDVHATVKTRTWHPIIILGSIIQFFFYMLIDLWDNIINLFGLCNPKQFSYTEKVTSFIVRNNLKKK